MDIEILNDSEAVARRAAAVIVEQAREAVAKYGIFTMAVSGGKTPWVMLRELAHEQVPWDKVHIFQIDERIAPAGDPDRNLTHLRESLLSRLLCGRSRSTPCLWKRQIHYKLPQSTQLLSRSSLEIHRCWTLHILVWVLMDTQRRWCQEIQC